MTTKRSPAESMIDSVVKPVENPVKGDGSLPYITHEGILEIGEKKLRCYILNNGMRIFDSEDVENFFNAHV